MEVVDIVVAEDSGTDADAVAIKEETAEEQEDPTVILYQY